MSDQLTTRATIVGFAAILMWSLLSTLAAYSGAVPPFLLTAITLFIGSLFGLFFWLRDPRLLRQLKQPFAVWFLSIIGLFGYHFLFFTAIRHSPPIEATLINYLWPLFIVIGSAIMPSEQLRWFHVAGALCGFLGMFLAITPGGSLQFDSRYTAGHLAALGGALTWTAYSLVSRRFARVPTSNVCVSCFATSILSLCCHFLFQEPHILPNDSLEWLAVIGLGIFPVGLSFYCWDFGVKYGNIQVLGAASYGAPLLSTALLIATGLAPMNGRIILACVLITGGALLASKNMLRTSRRDA